MLFKFTLTSNCSPGFNDFFEVSKLTLKLGVSGSSSASIHVTSALAVPLFPALSTNSNVNSPFSVNVYVFLP